jgi:hypothetical protein
MRVDQRTLDDVKQKFVRLYRQDPPPRIIPAPREPLAPILDRWVARRFSMEEVQVLMRLEQEGGQAAVKAWFDGVLDEARLAS